MKGHNAKIDWAVAFNIRTPQVEDLPCSMKILREFYFADRRFFCGLREQIFAVRDD